MSELPEQIYITEPKTYSDGETIPGTWVTKRDWCFKHEYRRADLPAIPLSAAMELPEVRELMEAMERAIEAIDAAYDGPDDNGAYTVRERAALAAIKEPKL